MHQVKILLAGVAILFSHLAYSGSDLLTNCNNHEERAKIISVASGELGVREDIAPNDALRIREYKKVIHSKFNYPVAWCAIFVSWVYTTTGLADKVPYGSEWVPSWSARPQFVIYKRGVALNQYPCPGDVVTFYFPNSRQEGHIGLVKEWPSKGDYFYTIEGNTNGAGSAEGDGVYVKMRRKTDAYRVMRFVPDAKVVALNSQTKLKAAA